MPTNKENVVIQAKAANTWITDGVSRFVLRGHNYDDLYRHITIAKEHLDWLLEAALRSTDNK